MKRLGSVLGQLVLTVYFLPVLVLTPYYNWTYAREHGFARWLFLGEIAATARAVIWPYVLLTPRGDLPHSSTEEDAGSRHPENPQPIAEEWPELSVDELGTISEIGGKAMTGEIDEWDVIRFRTTLESYLRRAKKPLSPQQAKVIDMHLTLVSDYNHELGRCALMSIDSQEPFFSLRFSELTALMKKSGYARPEKLQTDRNMILAAGTREPYSDEFGTLFHPPKREDILRGLAALEAVKRNLAKLQDVVHETAAHDRVR